MIGRTGIDFASAVVQPWNPGVTFSPSCGGFQGAEGFDTGGIW